MYIDASFGDDADAEGGEYAMLNGDGQTVNTNMFAPLSFRSEADYELFQEVRVDGITVDPSNYMVSKGSTIVTFDYTYTEMLQNGDHVVEIVSEDGSARANFSVERSSQATLGRFYEFVGLDNQCSECEGHYYVNGELCYACGTDQIPETLTNGLEYNDGTYLYVYYTDYNGWVVREVVDKTKTEYPAVLEKIGDKNVVAMEATFEGCSNMTKSPIIPSSITILYATFRNCTSLAEAPVIPNRVTELGSVFFNCTSLKGSITVHCTLEFYDETLFGTQITEILGNCGNKDALLATR